MAEIGDCRRVHLDFRYVLRNIRQRNAAEGVLGMRSLWPGLASGLCAAALAAAATMRRV